MQLIKTFATDSAFKCEHFIVSSFYLHSLQSNFAVNLSSVCNEQGDFFDFTQMCNLSIVSYADARLPLTSQ